MKRERQRRPTRRHRRTRGGGFAGGRRALKDEDRIGTGRAEGGSEPEEAAMPAGFVAMKPRAEAGERARVGRQDSGRERKIAATPVEVALARLDNLPPFAVDGDELAAPGAEVEDDGGLGGIAVEPGDSGEDGLAGRVTDGAGFEGADDAAEGEVRGRLAALIVITGEEPLAEHAGADGEDLASAWSEGEGEEGLAEVGGERFGHHGDLEEKAVGLGEASVKLAVAGAHPRGIARRWEKKRNGIDDVA